MERGREGSATREAEEVPRLARVRLQKLPSIRRARAPSNTSCPMEADKVSSPIHTGGCALALHETLLADMMPPHSGGSMIVALRPLLAIAWLISCTGSDSSVTP